MMMMMMMEEVVQEDHQNQVLGSKDISQIIKGKRTKRQRPLSPLALTMAVSTSSAEAITSNYSSPTTSTNYGLTEISTSTTTTTTTEEEEDMANCLILLAQGHLTPRKKPNTQKVLFQSDQKPAENNISAIDKSTGGAITSTGLFVYQCKTCDRCFSSFQALGGHRASHKKPKVNPDGNNNNKKGLLSFTEEENIIGHRSFDHQNSTSTDLSLQISNRIGLSYSSKTIAINKPKVHECSICGAEFTSGQALGGHMRRHRSFINTQTTAATTTSLSLVSSSPESHELKKSKNVLKLDLNLPAPEDDRRENKFPFAGKEQVIVFSHASPLVDCHY